MTRLWYLPTLLIVLGLVLGPGGAYVSVLAPEAAFGLFFGALAVAMLTLPFLAGAAAYASANGKVWRGHAVRSAVVPLLVVLGLVLPNGGKLDPLIHDITTDPEDSLQFTPDVAARPESMPREQVLGLQREAYPDIAPLTLQGEPDEVFERALATAEAMPAWTVVRNDPAAGIVEAETRSTVFRFVDDIVIRVQQGDEGGTSRIDVRSRSRVGQSDLGANAARIRAYFSALRAS